MARGAWFACVSPFFVTFLLTKVSGMAAMYEVNAKKWGKDAKCARRPQCLQNPSCSRRCCGLTIESTSASFARRYLKYLEETPAIYPFINVPVMTIFALPTAVVIFGVVKAIVQ